MRGLRPLSEEGQTRPRPEGAGVGLASGEYTSRGRPKGGRGLYTHYTKFDPEGWGSHSDPHPSG